jgi:hypothetical protein
VSGIQLIMMSSQEASASTEATGSFVSKPAGSKLQPYVVLSYGVADSLARVRITSLEEVEQLFESAPWSKQSVQAGAAAANSPATKQAIEQQILMADVAGLERAMENSRDGATPMVWNVRHCGKTSLQGQWQEAGVAPPCVSVSVCVGVGTDQHCICRSTNAGDCIWILEQRH